MSPSTSSGAYTILSLPPTLLLHVTSQLPSPYDIISLSLTHPILHTLLTTTGSTAICHVLSRCQHTYSQHPVFASIDLLRLTRAYQLPISSLRELCHFDTIKNIYTSPPTAEFIEDLANALPSLRELTRMIRLQQVVSAWEDILARKIGGGISRACRPELYSEDHPSFDPEKLNRGKAAEIMWTPQVRECFYRATYRWLLLCRLFSQAYLHPLDLVEETARANPAVDRVRAARKYPAFYRQRKGRRGERVRRRLREGLRGLYSGFVKWLLRDGTRRARDMEDKFGEGKGMYNNRHWFQGKDGEMAREELAGLLEIMMLNQIGGEAGMLTLEVFEGNLLKEAELSERECKMVQSNVERTYQGSIVTLTVFIWGGIYKRTYLVTPSTDIAYESNVQELDERSNWPWIPNVANDSLGVDVRTHRPEPWYYQEQYRRALFPYQSWSVCFAGPTIDFFHIALSSPTLRLRVRNEFVSPTSDDLRGQWLQHGCTFLEASGTPRAKAMLGEVLKGVDEPPGEWSWDERCSTEEELEENWEELDEQEREASRRRRRDHEEVIVRLMDQRWWQKGALGRIVHMIVGIVVILPLVCIDVIWSKMTGRPRWF